jgi:hypothetical protein
VRDAVKLGDRNSSLSVSSKFLLMHAKYKSTNLSIYQYDLQAVEGNDETSVVNILFSYQEE